VRQALAPRGHHLGHQQAGQHAVLLGNVAANGQPCRLLAADGDLVLDDQLADVFEAYRRLVERNFVVLGQRPLIRLVVATLLATPLRQPRVSTR